MAPATDGINGRRGSLKKPSPKGLKPASILGFLRRDGSRALSRRIQTDPLPQSLKLTEAPCFSYNVDNAFILHMLLLLLLAGLS
jgi:hypothetical protein